MDIQTLVNNTGKLLETPTITAKQLHECEANIEQALTVDRTNPGLWFMLGSIYLRMGRWALAEHWLRATLTHAPDMIEAINNLGYVLENLGERDEAIKLFRKAQKRNPKDPALLNNIATALVNSGTPEKALEVTTKALELDPNFVDAHWNKGLAHLELGQWREGWQEHTWGLKLDGKSSQSRKIRHYREKDATPYWDGTKGQSVVIYGEQGVGDEIMTASMLPDAARDASIAYEAHPRLVNIMRHSFPEFPIYGTRKNKWAQLAFPKWTKIDAKAPIFELGQFYRNAAEDFPRTAYLKPFDTFVDEYQGKMRQFGARPRIGIAWQGGTIQTRVDLRTIPLARWEPLLKAVDAEWFSLQYDPAEQPGMWAPIINEFCTDKDLTIHHWEEDINDLDLCYGGLIHTLDLIITVNTSLVHACGAYGVECWTLTPSKPAWRYGVKGDHMPWYGDWVRQIRQKGDDWAPVLGQVRHELEQWLSHREAA